MMDESTVTSPRFDWRMSESYYMSIQLSLDGLSFCILDPVTNVFHSVTDVTFDKSDPNFALQEQYILNCKDMRRKYRKVLVSVDCPAFTMIPLPLYEEQKIRSVLALTGVKVSPEDKILRNNVEAANSTTVFTIPSFLYFFIKNQFNGVDIFHTTTPIVSYMLQKRQNGMPGPSINVELSHDSMTVTAVDNDELKLCNRFYCRETLDYVYMILCVIRQLHMDARTVVVTIHGNVRLNDERIRGMKRFIKNVQVAEAPNFFSYGFAIPEQAHKFNSLFLMPLCV